jgi:hypothetical protein
MYCSGCGQALDPAQAFCPKCGRAVAPVVFPMPDPQFVLASYASKVRVLGILWLVYAGLSIILGFAGLAFANAFLTGAFGTWIHGPMPPNWIIPAVLHFAWAMLALRGILAAVAGWGLLERTEWGRIVAIIAAIVSLIKIPFGTALGIATLIILLGYRNSTLFEQL